MSRIVGFVVACPFACLCCFSDTPVPPAGGPLLLSDASSSPLSDAGSLIPDSDGGRAMDAAPRKRAFITKNRYPGYLNGIAGAQFACAGEAGTNLPNKWIAILAEFGAAPLDQIDKLSKEPRYFIGSDTPVVLSDSNQRFSTFDGMPVNGSERIWIGGNGADGPVGGLAASKRCEEWGRGDVTSGAKGLALRLDQPGTLTETLCTEGSRLLCFEQ
jgi:hypothetical protein